MDLTPSVSLLQDIRSGQMIKCPLDWILLFSSFISKKLLLKNWKSSMCPSLQEWKMQYMLYYFKIEKGLATDNNKVQQFDSIWGKINNNNWKIIGTYNLICILFTFYNGIFPLTRSVELFLCLLFVNLINVSLFFLFLFLFQSVFYWYCPVIMYNMNETNKKIKKIIVKEKIK